MTRDELQAAVFARSATSDPTIAITAINNAYQEIVGAAHLNPAKVTLPLVAGTDGYSLNALLTTAVGNADFYGLIEMYGLDTASNPSPMEQNDLSHIVRLRAAAAMTGQPTNFALVGLDQLEIVPVPISGQQITMWYDRWRAANNLTAGANTPVLLPEPFHDLIDLRASMQIASRYESTGENAALAQKIGAEYATRTGEWLAYLRKRQGKQTRRMTTGYRRFARLRPSVPSQDLGGRW